MRVKTIGLTAAAAALAAAVALAGCAAPEEAREENVETEEQTTQDQTSREQTTEERTAEDDTTTKNATANKTTEKGTAEPHTIAIPDELAWQDGPPSLPAGARFAVLSGDPTQEGPFTMRVELPADYRIPPHTHPGTERVTVISGSGFVGMGDTIDEGNATPLPEDAFFVMPPGMEHYFFTGNETAVLQLHGEGPWDIVYLDPADDPRA